MFFAVVCTHYLRLLRSKMDTDSDSELSPPGMSHRRDGTERISSLRTGAPAGLTSTSLYDSDEESHDEMVAPARNRDGAARYSDSEEEEERARVERRQAVAPRAPQRAGATYSDSEEEKERARVERRQAIAPQAPQRAEAIPAPTPSGSSALPESAPPQKGDASPFPDSVPPSVFVGPHPKSDVPPSVPVSVSPPPGSPAPATAGPPAPPNRSEVRLCAGSCTRFLCFSKGRE